MTGNPVHVPWCCHLADGNSQGAPCGALMSLFGSPDVVLAVSLRWSTKLHVQILERVAQGGQPPYQAKDFNFSFFFLYMIYPYYYFEGFGSLALTVSESHVTLTS